MRRLLFGFIAAFIGFGALAAAPAPAQAQGFSITVGEPYGRPRRFPSDLIARTSGPSITGRPRLSPLPALCAPGLLRGPPLHRALQPRLGRVRVGGARRDLPLRHRVIEIERAPPGARFR